MAAAGDIVYFDGRPLYVVSETDEGDIVASPLNAPTVFYSGEGYDGYPFHADNLTDANGDPIKGPAKKSEASSSAKVGGKS